MSDKRQALLQAYQAIQTLEAKLKASEHKKAEPIAIIGMGCRFPGGSDPQEFWKTLHNGVDTTAEHPTTRWDIEKYYDATLGLPGKIYTRRGAYIETVDEFDPHFFGISPREAKNMDPQQRLVLEVSWEALENANIPPDTLQGSRTGAYLGVSNTDYFLLAANQIGFDQYLGLGVDPSLLAGRLSYILGLQGPSMTVATVCSSSLVSLHLACNALRANECDVALAGGVHLNLAPQSTMYVSMVQALSPDGRCKTFDETADGYGRGEGCGMITMKRLSDAIADKDHIQGVIRGSAVNHDGPSGGLTVPNGPAQEKVLQQALKVAGVAPADISYIEAHGTGTPLGDPIEIRALDRVLNKDRDKQNPLIIGSVKTNIGHLEAAGGVAGVIKTVLSMQHDEIPPHLHFDQPNPHIAWDTLPIKIPKTSQSWPIGERLAGVSAFGMSGTNAHLIVGEAPVIPQAAIADSAQTEIERPQHILTLSAKTKPALLALATRYINYFTEHPTASLANVCFTANTGRTHHAHRLSLVAHSSNECCNKLASFITNDDSDHATTNGALYRNVSNGGASKVAFLFTGQGSQYVDMGKELYETQPVFRKVFEHCTELTRPYLACSLFEVLYQQDNEIESNITHDVNNTAYAQPALFAIEYALSKLWESWGVTPSIVMGHSVGEYVAACIAGVFSVEDGLKLISARARLMAALPQEGNMFVIAATEEDVAMTIAPYTDEVSIAAVNGTQNIVISGKTTALLNVIETFQIKGIKTTQLSVSHAFHSSLMEPMLADFKQVADTINYSSPKIRIISNLTGQLITSEIATSDYWCQHIRHAVKFSTSITTLYHQNIHTFIEIGPKPILLGMGRQCLESFITEDTSTLHWLPSLRSKQTDSHTLFTSLSTLYLQGAKIDWERFDEAYKRRKVTLPTYPFQRQQYWMDESIENKTIDSNPMVAAEQADVTRLSPLIDRVISSPLLTETLFETRFSLQAHSFFRDHQIYDQVVVPAAAYISYLLNAIKLAFEHYSCQLEDMVFPEPMVIAEDKVRTVQLVLTPSDEAMPNAQEDKTFTFKLISFTDQEQKTHAIGRVGVLSEQDTPKPISIKTWQTDCQNHLSGEAFYAAEGDLYRGASFQWLDQCWYGDNAQSLGVLSPPKGVQWEIHPGLIDSCFQLVGLRKKDEEQQAFIPFAIAQFKLYNMPNNQRLWCSIKPTGDQRWNLQLASESGELIADIVGYEIVKVEADAFEKTKIWQDWLYENTWQPQSTAEQPATLPVNKEKTGRWLIFTDEKGVGRQLVTLLQAKGQQTHLLPVTQDSEDFKQLVYRHLLDNITPYQGIIYLSATDKVDQHVDLYDSEQGHCINVLYLVQAMQQLKTRLYLVTRNTQSLHQQPTLGASALWGLGRTITFEHPEAECLCLDLGNDSVVNEAQSIFDTLSTPAGETQIAIHKNKRYVARLARHQTSKTSPLLINKQGSYLITGGLGGLGLKIAAFLVEQGARHLVLCGRSKASPMANLAIEALEQQDVDVLVVQADVSKENEIAKVLSICCDPLCGIIHAAGVLDDGVLLQQSAERFDKVMRPKVKGALNLHHLTRNMTLDFFVCFSSNASLMGSAGQGNYAAANAFLDALAHYRKSIGLAALTINWGAWDEIGMAATLLDHSKNVASQGERFISPTLGLQVLDHLLNQTQAQVGVVAMDWKQFTSTIAPLFFSNFIKHSVTKKQTNHSLLEKLSDLDVVEYHSHLLGYLKKQLAPILLLTPDDIEIDAPLNTMGLDSLMAIDIRAKIKKNLDIDLPIVKLLEGITIIELATLLETERVQITTSDATQQQMTKNPVFDLSDTQISTESVEGEL